MKLKTPNIWINRDISPYLERDKSFVQILMGPRQCGKSSLLLKLNSDFIELNMDILQQRELAQSDPGLLFKQYAGKKILIDEAQLAPNLFSEIKRIVDQRKRDHEPKQTIFRLTGSNQILMDTQVKESLAGRASYFNLNTLSVAEILSDRSIPISEILFKGGWPELYAYPETQQVPFLNSYLTSYLEKDIVLSAGIQKQAEFLKFTRLLAGRTAQVLNASEIGKEVGVESSTIKDWISVLQKMRLIALLEPYSSNLSKRIIKSPKVYFLDTGLACRLQGWTDPTPLLTSPQAGALFETLVFGEIYRLIQNHQLNWNLFFWRTKDGEEIDFLIETSPTDHLLIEAKLSPQQGSFKIKDSSEVKKVFKKIADPIVCHMEGEGRVGQNIPISMLKSHLLSLHNLPIPKVL